MGAEKKMSYLGESASWYFTAPADILIQNQHQPA